MEWKSSRMAKVIKLLTNGFRNMIRIPAAAHPPRRRKTPFSESFESTDGYSLATAA